MGSFTYVTLGINCLADGIFHSSCSLIVAHGVGLYSFPIVFLLGFIEFLGLAFQSCSSRHTLSGALVSVDHRVLETFPVQKNLVELKTQRNVSSVEMDFIFRLRGTLTADCRM